MANRGRFIDRRGLSPIFATVLLATIVIVVGSVAFYFSSNLVTNAANQYTGTISGSQQSISERIGFENVVYNPSSPATLTVYIINCGAANNLQINSIFIYDVNHNIVGQPYSGSSSISALFPIDGSSPTPIPGNSLNVGKEGYFTVTLNGTLAHGSAYTIDLITSSQSRFNYDFTP